ncbi:MAG: glycosyltransferase [Thermoanaerobaculia bacterium]
MPKVVAIIVHPGGAALLARAVESLLASPGVDLDVVIVANACNEELPVSVTALERVHIVRSRRAIGFSAANNLGARWARGHLAPADYVYFINNDTRSEPDALRRLVRALEEEDGATIAGPRLMILGAPGYLNSLGLNVTATGEAWDEGIGRELVDGAPLPARRDVLAVTGAALLISAAELARLGGWEELYGFYFEDIDLCLRARSHGSRVVVDADAVVHHAISATAVRASDFKIQLSWRNRFLLLLARWPWPTLLAVTPKLAATQLLLLARRWRGGHRHDARLQLRAWGGVLKRLGPVLGARRGGGPRSEWRRELRPHGSVPAIELPPIDPAA